MIKIIIPSYNNQDYVYDNVIQALSQEHDDFEVLYMNDCSTDKTIEFLGNIDDPRLKIIHSTKRQGNVYGIWNAVMYHTKKDDICVILDGDDELKNSKVLQRVQEEYDNPNTWMTYGSYETSSGAMGCSSIIPTNVIIQNSHRSAPWRASHLRTFKSWLFRLIKKEDLMYNGQFINTAGDLAITFPLLEMAGGHASFIPDILYIYNDDTGQNDHTIRRKKQIAMEMVIRRRQRYTPLQPFMNDTYLNEYAPF